MDEMRNRTRQGRRGRIVTALKVLNVRLRFILLMVAVGLVAAQWDAIVARVERLGRGERGADSTASAYEYYCPMHPSVVRAEQGNCPICGMPLTQRRRGEKPALPEGVLGRVQLSPHRIQLAGVGTSEVGFRSLSSSIRAVGTIELDERRLARISSRIPGRIEKLHVDFTGETVSRHEALLEIYSPELVSAQQEYLLALRSYEDLSGAGPLPASDAKAIFDAARERLRLWGIGDDQIAEIEARGTPMTRLPIRSPIAGTVVEKQVVAGQYVEEGALLYTVADLSSVWITAHLYENEIARVKIGAGVRVTTRALPDRVFAGEVAFIWPVVDEGTRTVRVRADVANPGGALRPGMYVDAEIATESGVGIRSEQADARYICPMHPEVVQTGPGRCPKCGMFLERVESAPAGTALVVPESAVIDTGTRKVVYLEREPGVYDAVAVDLGSREDGHYPVRGGLAPGDRIVTAGAFLVDAELRLNPGAASAYFGASGSPNGADSRTPHDHD